MTAASKFTLLTKKQLNFKCLTRVSFHCSSWRSKLVVWRYTRSSRVPFVKSEDFPFQMCPLMKSEEYYVHAWLNVNKIRDAVLNSISNSLYNGVQSARTFMTSLAGWTTGPHLLLLWGHISSPNSLWDPMSVESLLWSSYYQVRCDFAVCLNHLVCAWRVITLKTNWNCLYVCSLQCFFQKRLGFQNSQP